MLDSIRLLVDEADSRAMISIVEGVTESKSIRTLVIIVEHTDTNLQPAAQAGAEAFLSSPLSQTLLERISHGVRNIAIMQNRTFGTTFTEPYRYFGSPDQELIKDLDQNFRFDEMMIAVDIQLQDIDYGNVDYESQH